MINSSFSIGGSIPKALLLMALSVITSVLVLLASPKSWFLTELSSGSADWAARDCAYNERNGSEASLTQDQCRLSEGNGRPVYLMGTQTQPITQMDFSSLRNNWGDHFSCNMQVHAQQSRSPWFR